MPLSINVQAYQKAFAAFQLILFNAGLVAGDLQTTRRRCTIAEINAGVLILPPVPGFGYRVINMSMVAVGGAVGGSTTIDVLGTQGAASVKLLAVAIAALTQSAKVRDGAANATILADGASFVKNDSGTGLTVSKTGASATTATAVDVEINFILEAD